jgi:hypothetical protein
MRASSAPTAPAEDREVRVPLPSELGRLPGPPPLGELPPGALTAPARAASPPLPPADPLRAGLGPRMAPAGNGEYLEDRARFTARVERDGRIRFRDKGNVQLEGGLGLSFDVTDAVMRAIGQDPYQSEKLRIMDRTRETRAGMARVDREDRLRTALRKLPAELERVWSHGLWTPAQRRRALFALWDEAAEDGDPDLVRAGDEARATVLAFIARRLPEGSPDAFTAEELAALNRVRRSRRPFAPYGR